VNAHLRDCENDQGDRNTRTPDECGARDEEGHNGEQDREPKSYQVALNSSAISAPSRRWSPGAVSV